MKRRLAALLLAVFFAAVPAQAERDDHLGYYDLTVEHEDGEERYYSLLVFRPAAGEIDPETRFLLRHFASFLGYVYQQDRFFEQAAWPSLRRGIDEVGRGNLSFAVVTAHRDPFQPYQAIAVAGEGPLGTPSEARLVDRGARRFERAELAERVVPMVHYNPLGALARNEEISAFLSRRPWLVGGTGSHAELTKFAKSPDCPRDFSGVLHDALVANGITRWGGPLPEGRRLPPLEGALAVEARRLAAAYPDLPPELWYPERQTRTVLTDLQAHAVDGTRVILYRRFFAFPPPEQFFFDEDLAANARLFRLERSRWEAETGRRLALRIDDVRNPRLDVCLGHPMDIVRTPDVRRPGHYARTVDLRNRCGQAVVITGRSVPLRYYPTPGASQRRYRR